jgi:hypothetical protein
LQLYCLRRAKRGRILKLRRASVDAQQESGRPLRRHKGDAAEMVVITRAYALVLDVTERVRKFPRDLRFVLGDRILSTAYDVLDGLIQARYTADRRSILRAANLQLERLRFQVRLASDLQVISIRQYELLAEGIYEIGGMVGAWTKSTAI